MQAAARVAIPSRDRRPRTAGPVRRRVARTQSGLQHVFVSFVTGTVIGASFPAPNVAQRVLNGQQLVEMDRLQKSIQQERATQEGLLTQAKELRSPERVARIAVRKLAMRKPASVRYLYLPASLFAEPEADALLRRSEEPAPSYTARPRDSRGRSSIGSFFSRAGKYLASLVPGASNARATRN